MAYSRQTSVEQFEMDKSALPQRPAAGQGSWWSRLTKKTKLILAAVIAVVVIGLAVGLGVGLTVGKGGNSGDNTTPPASTFSATPSPGPTNIWQPAVNSSWQIVLLYPLNLNEQNTSVSPDVDVYDIDMFNNNETVINKLHDLGKKVICYFSAGSYEDWRDDAGDFKDSDKGKNLDGWPGEKWIDTNSDNVRSIMKTRIEYAANKGCDAVDPDNVDGYNNDNGLGLTQSDAINYIQYLASVALPLNMSIGLKNAGEIIPDVLNVTQFSVNEQCVEFSECTTFSPFIEAAKPVFNIEYPKNIPSIKTTDTNTICDDSGKSAGSSGFSILMKNMNLNGWVQYCDGSVYNTTVSTASTNSTSS